MRDLGRRGRGYFVARFVNRRDLDEAVDAL
jgi:hypothetical protein